MEDVVRGKVSKSIYGKHDIKELITCKKQQ